MARRNFRKRHKIRKKTFFLKSKYFWFFFLFLFFSFVVFYFSFFWNNIQVRELNILGNETINKEEIEKIVFDNIERNFFFKSSKSILFVGTSKLEREILNFFPKIKEVNVSRDFFNSLDIEIREREKFASFCSQEKCFNIDEKGIVFEIMKEDFGIMEAMVSSQENDLIIELVEKREKISLGEKVLEKEILDIVSKIEEKFEENDFQIEIEKVVVDGNEKLNVITNENWKVYFNLEKNIELQILKLILLLEEEISIEERKELEYIDLRFSRVYYK